MVAHCMRVYLVTSVVFDSVTLWTIVHQAPLSMGFSSQEYWSGLCAILQGIFLIQGPNPQLLHCRQTLLGKPMAVHSLPLLSFWHLQTLQCCTCSILTVSNLCLFINNSGTSLVVHGWDFMLPLKGRGPGGWGWNGSLTRAFIILLLKKQLSVSLIFFLLLSYFQF